MDTAYSWQSKNLQMLKKHKNTEGLLNAPPYQFWFWITVMLTMGSHTSLQAQHHYIGVGFHLTPPVRFDYASNANVIVRPQPGLAGSITYKKEWAYKTNKKWYWEAGLTTQSLRFYQVSYSGDSTAIWSDWVNEHTGFPSILLGGGHSFRIGKSKGEFSVGAELSFLIVQDLDEIGSISFGIFNDPMQHQTFPLFFRLNFAYNHELHFFKIPGQLQIYTNLSAQKLTKGTQYIRNPDGGYSEGAYHVNNSELGIKLFACLNKKTQKPVFETASQNAILAQKGKRLKYRISLTGQLFNTPRTVYHIPQVDSFSVKGRDFLTTPQLGVFVEFPHRKNDLWSTVIGLGMGPRVASMIFKSDGRFPSDNQPIEFEKHISIGHYVIANLGLSRRHAIWGGHILSHTLSGSVVFPVEKEYEYLGVPLSFNNNGNQLPPYENPILEGWVDYEYGREPVLFGVEYNPEIIFNLRNRSFIAVGLVANYSKGVIAQGNFEVFNTRRSYYGALLQKFSKLGLTVRFGFEKQQR
ncbi:MAG: hypothetical protein OHK0019_37810 [Saprospiraceae bacterium]